MLRTKLIASFCTLTVAAGLALSAPALAAPTTQPVKPYPLKTCMVTGEELGEMGDPIVKVYNGQEIKFCCGSCVKKFEKNPEKYLSKLDKAPTTKPS